ncbi:MAG: hypothetical protein ABIQ73_14950 [Acidimicrobiales bacterium]
MPPTDATRHHVDTSRAGGKAMPTTAERFTRISEQLEAATAAVEADAGSSPVLIAVVRELSRKTQKAVDGLATDDEAALRMAIVEVEQAADSAKAAAEADLGISDAARQSVIDGHLAICILKAKTI